MTLASEECPGSLSEASGALRLVILVGATRGLEMGVSSSSSLSSTGVIWYRCVSYGA